VFLGCSCHANKNNKEEVTTQIPKEKFVLCRESEINISDCCGSVLNERVACHDVEYRKIGG
jgi:hypothetical protein